MFGGLRISRLFVSSFGDIAQSNICAVSFFSLSQSFRYPYLKATKSIRERVKRLDNNLQS